MFSLLFLFIGSLGMQELVVILLIIIVLFGAKKIDQELKIGDKIIFEDMIHYTMVKTTTFNGVTHPSIGIWDKNDKLNIVKTFGYEDYKNRLS